MRLLYSLALYLLSPLVFLYLLLRGWRDRGYWQGWGQRLGFCGDIARPGGIVVHAVSMGEVNAAEELIRQLALRYPELPLTVTCFTPTGSRRIQTLFGDSVAHTFWPLDLPGAVGRFLGKTRPRLLIVLETEIWPNLYARCHRLGIPLLLVNARISRNSYSRYQRFHALTSATLGLTRTIGAQSAEDLSRYLALGAPPESTHLTGNLKYDLRLPEDLGALGQILRQSWGAERPVWLAASTREGEEAVVLGAFASILKRFPSAMLVIVPRHPERFEEVASLVSRSGVALARFSQQQPGQQHWGRASESPESANVYLVDAMGELLRFYAACDVAFVGGSLANTGGHNVLEAAALARPVLVGPNTYNFAQISQQLIDGGGAIRVADQESLQQAVCALFEDAARRQQMGESGRALVAAEQGALSRTLELIDLALKSLPDYSKS